MATSVAAVPFRNLLTVPGRARYLAWTLLKRRGELCCRLRSGPLLSIRPAPSDDWETAYEVFRERAYDTGLPADDVRRIVDLGGYVGYSTLYWCSTYPRARVLAYEPHPTHCDRHDWHMRANHYADRVTLIRAAAATAGGEASLKDDGFRSRVVEDASSGHGVGEVLRVPQVDFFETVGPEPIDILKVDIEGDEYRLLQDARFDDLARRVGCVVMEWHLRAPGHRGGAWCHDRLTRLGFAVDDLAERSRAADLGMLLAMRHPTPGRRSGR